MNIDELKDRLNQLNAQLQGKQNIIDQTVCDMNAIHGAIQEVNYWINQIKSNNKEE